MKFKKNMLESGFKIMHFYYEKSRLIPVRNATSVSNSSGFRSTEIGRFFQQYYFDIFHILLYDR
jgi:hypothetical protein